MDLSFATPAPHEPPSVFTAATVFLGFSIHYIGVESLVTPTITPRPPKTLHLHRVHHLSLVIICTLV